MSKNTLIHLPDFELPLDFPWRVRFVAAVDAQLRRMRATGHYEPGRFFGYFCQGAGPVGVSGNWTVALEDSAWWLDLNENLERRTEGKYSIMCRPGEIEPGYILIHDRLDGSCWLWRFAYGMRFVGATDALAGLGTGNRDDEIVEDDGGDRTLLGP